MSAGRVCRVQAEGFIAIYVPSPVTNEYAVLLNELATEGECYRALRAVVGHHTEKHIPRTIHVFSRTGPPCRRCEERVRRSA